MRPASSILLCLAAVSTHEHVFRYMKPWDPFRRSMTDCEICYKGDCVFTQQARCEYYAEASKLLAEEPDDRVDSEHRDDNKVDRMIFDLVDAASSTPNFRRCIPLVSQYTNCNEENTCIGCTICNCNEQGKWICSTKQKCKPESSLNIDHRVIGIVSENLKKRKKRQENRVKRSAGIIKTVSKNIKDKLTHIDISEWVYGVEPSHLEEKNIDLEEILEYLKYNRTEYNKVDRATVTTIRSESPATDNTKIKSDNYVDLLEFNDILQSWTIEDLNTKKPFVLIDTPQNFYKHRSKEIHINDIDYIEYDPIRLIKRETSKLESNESSNVPQLNNNGKNLTYELILTDALQGLNKITKEKQKELEELLNIQNNLLNVATEYNISIDMNATTTHDNYNKHHIAIYKLDSFEKCIDEAKHEICNTIDVIKSDATLNSSDFERDLKAFFSTIRKYMYSKNYGKVDTNTKVIMSQELDQNQRKHVNFENTYHDFDPVTLISSILEEINKAATNPLETLSHHARKILKRVIKQLYLDDFAVIDLIVHETYYDFDSYLENIGTKWSKMMQDIIQSEVFDSLYRVKLLHMTLKADISKMEDMITLLDFARNRRMTVSNGATIDKSISRIQNNLQLIDNSVQNIIKSQVNKRMRQRSSNDKQKSPKRKSVLQTLKKIFQKSKTDIKNMLRKRFPKSEIVKQIAKTKLNQLEKQNMLDYQDTMKQLQENMNVDRGREKRSTWGFQTFVDRIKSIIPGYLRGKVKPAMQKKKVNRTDGGNKRRVTNTSTIKTTTAI